MVKLEPLQQEDFESYLESSVRSYAADHVRNGNWPAEGSLERSRQEFDRHLPDGIHTRDQYLYSIRDENGQSIGVLWVQVRDQKAFIFDFIITEAQRGKGYGRQALRALDEKLAAHDVESVSLHVFGDNVVAQELYKKAGFEITGIHMKKNLRQDTQPT